ncbi:hypothetical protein HK101_001852 [Irineochytrium annulatum]|nr:hypothetical protein HK101_001852 [Irineochytrium annulatum]
MSSSTTSAVPATAAVAVQAAAPLVFARSIIKSRWMRLFQRSSFLAAIILLALSRADALLPTSNGRFRLALRSLVNRLVKEPGQAVASAIRKLIAYFDDSEGTLSSLGGIFTTTKIETFLLAYLPTSRFGERIKTGVYPVDMFINTALAAVLVSSFTMAKDFTLYVIGTPKETTDLDSVKVRVEYLRHGIWWGSVNEYHVALSWLISKASTDHKEGEFRMVPYHNEYKRSAGNDDDSDDEDQANLLDFNLLPGDEASILFIKHEGHEFRVNFDFSRFANDEKRDAETNASPEPPIIIQRVGSGPTSIQWMKDWMSRVALEYVKFCKSNAVRGRYEYDTEEGTWKFVHALHSSRGLQSVALDKIQGELLENDLGSFLADQEFYANLGVPYRRGYLFSGKPGTGKTSLINAISASHNRDLYHINLKGFTEDKQLQNAFARVPKNSLVIFEDVDAQSKCVWDRSRKPKSSFSSAIGPMSLDAMIEAATTASDEISLSSAASDSSVTTAVDGSTPASTTSTPDSTSTTASSSSSIPFAPPPPESGPTLATLLNVMDGHSSAPGTIVIMTSNHPEVLDPALTRPGRIDLHLSLGYCTLHQLETMYRNVSGDAGARLWKDGEERVPEGVIAPCDAMRIMMLHRRERDVIREELAKRCREILEGRPGAASGGAVVGAPVVEVHVTEKEEKAVVEEKAEEKMVVKENVLVRTAPAEAAVSA